MSRLDPLTAYDDEPTVQGGVHHPYSAFNQGFDAAEARHPLSTNPYPAGREARAWDDGHRTARFLLHGEGRQ